MLWPLILPFKITAAVLVAVIAILSLAAPRFKWRRGPVFFYSCLVGIVGFVPSCGAIMSVIDSQRFGTFEHATFAEVNDFRVERYLPPAAREITLRKHGTGFRAKFSIAQSDLDTYLNTMWNKYAIHSTTRRGEMESDRPLSADSHDDMFGDLGWEHLPDAIEYCGPQGQNGAGFTIWFSPSAEIAYERAGYW